jgi:antitoxin component YwqK of YwqJK toxin-antitoxin module
MKTYITLLVLVALSFGGLRAQSKYCDKLVRLGDTIVCQDFTGKGKLFREHYYVNGERVFTRWWRFKKKSKEYEVVQKLGKSPFAKKNGPAYVYFPSGKMSASTVFEHNKKIGPCKEYYQSGVLKQTCERHIKGKTHGIVSNYYENGQIKAQARWDNGRLREILQYKDEQGQNLPIGTFKDGNGTWTYLEDGNKKFVYTFKQGKIVRRKRLKE